MVHLCEKYYLPLLLVYRKLQSAPRLFVMNFHISLKNVPGVQGSMVCHFPALTFLYVE